jgi:hypothetical protein
VDLDLNRIHLHLTSNLQGPALAVAQHGFIRIIDRGSHVRKVERDRRSGYLREDRVRALYSNRAGIEYDLPERESIGRTVQKQWRHLHYATLDPVYRDNHPGRRHLYDMQSWIGDHLDPDQPGRTGCHAR